MLLEIAIETTSTVAKTCALSSALTVSGPPAVTSETRRKLGSVAYVAAPVGGARGAAPMYS